MQDVDVAECPEGAPAPDCPGRDIPFQRIVEEGISEIYTCALPDLRITYANHAALRNTGYTMEEICRLTPADLMNGLGPHRLRRLLAPLLRGDRDVTAFEAFHSRRDGSTYPVSVRFRVFERRAPLPPLLVAYPRDITRRRARNEALRRLAELDPLTGLANRRLLTAHLRRLLARRRAGTVGILLSTDVDDFRRVNEVGGHLAGDRTIRALARAVRSAVPADALVARTGGNEFAVLLPGASLAEAEVVVRRVHASAESVPLPARDAGDRLRLSTGITPVTAGEDLDGLIVRADEALSASKRRGDHGWVVQRADENDRVERLIRSTLAQGRLDHRFQPIWSLRTGDLLGFEALARFPGGFAPDLVWSIALRNGVCSALDRVSIISALEQGRTLPGKLFINICARTLVTAGTATGYVRAAVRRFRVRPSDLVFEVTEDSVEDASPTHPGLCSLLAEGALVALDDAGAGRSTEARLAVLQPAIAFVKLDHRVLQAWVERRDGGLPAWVRTARDLGLSVVAEGVEDRSLAPLLAAEGIEAVQGFAFGRPHAARTWVPSRLAALGPGAR